MNTQQEQRSTMLAQIIRPMFISLPLPRGVDADDLLAGYLVALEGLKPATLKSVVVQLVKGLWYEEVKFCPRPPELANMVRFEERRQAAMNRPRLPAPAVSTPGFKDIRVTHRLRAEELSLQGYVFIAECNGHEQFRVMGRQGKLQTGAIHLWAIDEVWAPRVSTAQDIEQEYLRADMFEAAE